MADLPGSSVRPPNAVVHRILRAIPAMLWMVLIFWLSAQPVLPHPGRAYGIRDQVVDYAAHGAMFGFLALLVWWALRDVPSAPRLSPHTGRLRTALLLAALYAVTDELHQIAVPGRCATLPDLVADLVGIGLAGSALALLCRRTTRNLPPSPPGTA